MSVNVHPAMFSTICLQQGNLYLNPGSVSIPKENSPHSYMTLEGNTMQWKELESSAVFHELTL